ncbi:MAG: hypothetical protein R2856_29475 [Caldilineaceae bacterium]
MCKIRASFHWATERAARLDLSAQHGGVTARRPTQGDIYLWIDQVTLVEDRTRWWDSRATRGDCNDLR